MKRILSILTSTLFRTGFLLSLLLTACSATATAPVRPAVIDDTPLPGQLIEFTPIPTLTTEIQPTAKLPTLTPPATQSGQPNVIRFDANGTYTDITDSIALGSSKTYSINAMKGQIMSISILPKIPAGGWGYIPIQIKGADGSILCPQSADSECMFWRGVLPSSQDYFVTLTPNSDANVPQFTLRVAINPPGKKEQTFQYKNPMTGLTLVYFDQFAPSLFPSSANNKTNPELMLQFIDTNFYVNTNLGEVYFLLGSSSDPQIIATCTAPNQTGGALEEVNGSEVINGYNFIHSQAMGAGAGNIYEQEIYRTVSKNVCYEAIYFIHYLNFGNYAPGAVTEFDSKSLMQKLSDVLSTFIIK